MYNFAATSIPSSSYELCPDFPMQRAEDDEFMSGLVEQMAHSMLDDEQVSLEDLSRIPGPLPTWIQERARAGSWSSSNTTPSPAVSPPTPLHHHLQLEQNRAWELLQLAAQEVLRLKMGGSVPLTRPHSREDQIWAYRQAMQRDFPVMYNSDSRTKLPCPSALEQHDWRHRGTTGGNPCSGFQYRSSSHGSAWQTRRSRSFNQQQNRQANRSCYPPGSSVNRYTVQQQQHHNVPAQWSSLAGNDTANNGSGMRALFLRGPGLGSTSTGTGVFLPQASGTSREHRKKRPCSSVLLPSHIVKVLNLNVDDLHCGPATQAMGAGAGAGSACYAARKATETETESYSSAHLSKSYSACSPTRWHHRPSPAATAAAAAAAAVAAGTGAGAVEPVLLPTEWTY